MYPPSMIAASSIGAAIHGLTARLDKQWSSPKELLSKLHDITGIDVVSITFVIFAWTLKYKVKEKSHPPTNQR